MDNRKVVIFIIEGVSDKWYVKSLCDKCGRLNKEFKIEFIIIKGDMTSRFINKENSIKNFIVEKINQLRRREKLDWSEIAQIVHVVDADGAYIPAENIIVDNSRRSFTYSEDAITCDSSDKAIQRNGHKQKLLNVLTDDNPPKGKKAFQINSRPYHVYYMSCNIEHVFWGKEYMCIDGVPNDVNRKKEELSLTFQEKANNALDPQEFLNETIINAPYSYPYDVDLPDAETANYIKSWKYIKEGTNSLKRMTNLNLFFMKYIGNRQIGEQSA